MLEHRFQPPRNSTTLVVVFSHARIPSGKFGLERLFAGTQHACLFVNHVGSGWYLDQEAAIDRLIDTAQHDVKPSRLIYYGASMGAYGALITGLRRQDGEIYAFGPELDVGGPGTQSLEALGYRPLQAPDVTWLLAQDLPFRTHVFFGLYDWVDAYGYDKIRRLPPHEHLNVYGLKSPHSSHDHLYTLNIVRRIIKSFNRDIELILKEKNISCEMGRSDLEIFVQLGQSLQDPTLLPGKIKENSQEKLAYRHPGHALLWAEAKARIGTFESALAVLDYWQQLFGTDTDLRNCPKRWRKSFPLLEIDILRRADRLDDAVQSLNALVARYPVCERVRETAAALSVSLS